MLQHWHPAHTGHWWSACRWSCCSLVSNHTQRSWISSAPHEHVSRLTAVEEPGLRLVSTSPGGSSSCGLAQSLFDSVSPGLALLRASVTSDNPVPCFHPPSLHLFWVSICVSVLPAPVWAAYLCICRMATTLWSLLAAQYFPVLTAWVLDV